MSGIMKPCPWCHGSSIDWVIQPYSSYAHAVCEDCGAQGPAFHVKSRTDRDAVTIGALDSWNGYSA